MGDLPLLRADLTHVTPFWTLPDSASGNHSFGFNLCFIFGNYSSLLCVISVCVDVCLQSSFFVSPVTLLSHCFTGRNQARGLIHLRQIFYRLAVSSLALFYWKSAVRRKSIWPASVMLITLLFPWFIFGETFLRRCIVGSWSHMLHASETQSWGALSLVHQCRAHLEQNQEGSPVCVLSSSTLFTVIFVVLCWIVSVLAGLRGGKQGYASNFKINISYIELSASLW